MDMQELIETQVKKQIRQSEDSDEMTPGSTPVVSLKRIKFWSWPAEKIDNILFSNLLLEVPQPYYDVPPLGTDGSPLREPSAVGNILLRSSEVEVPQLLPEGFVHDLDPEGTYESTLMSGSEEDPNGHILSSTSADQICILPSSSSTTNDNLYMSELHSEASQMSHNALQADHLGNILFAGLFQELPQPLHIVFAEAPPTSTETEVTNEEVPSQMEH